MDRKFFFHNFIVQLFYSSIFIPLEAAIRNKTTFGEHKTNLK